MVKNLWSLGLWSVVKAAGFRLRSQVSSFRSLLAFLTLAFTFPLTSSAQNQTINGNLTVTGSIEAAGSIDTGSNTLTFGTQGSSFGGALLHQDNSTDTFTFFSNRNPASWLWQHTVGIAAMRLDANHQLILYQANGTTAGVTLAPASNSIKLGTHANGTLTADANGLITAGGGFAVAGGITNTNGTLTGGAAGLALNAGGTNQNITLNSSGGDLVFSTSSTERMRIKATGNVGIGTTVPVHKLHVNGGHIFSSNTSADTKLYLGEDENGSGGSFGYVEWDRSSDLIQLGTSAGGDTLTINESGNVGIGTTAPGQPLEVYKAGNAVIAIHQPDAPAPGKYAQLTLTHGPTYFGANDKSWQVVSNGLATSEADLAFQYWNGSGYKEAVRITNGGNVGIGTTASAAKLDVFSGGAMTAGGYNGQLATLQVGHTGGAAANADGATIVLSQQYWSGDPASIVRVGAIVGYKGQSDGSFGGGMKFRVQPVGANPLLDVMTLAMSGNVGIGTTTPGAKLHLVQDSDVSESWLRIEDLDDTPNSMVPTIDFFGRGNLLGQLRFSDALGFQVRNSAQQIQLTVLNDGSVGIGTTSPSHKLAVNGTIRAKEVIVDTGWADYVFEEDYRLAPLAEVEQHIREKKHLPGIPSAAEVAAHGVSMGDMQSKLLSKVEELTLHLIRMEKENADLRERVHALETASTKP